jgi:hypothetical protein
MKYVLDASVAVCWVLPRPLTAEALKLRDEFLQQIHELIVPLRQSFESVRVPFDLPFDLSRRVARQDQSDAKGAGGKLVEVLRIVMSVWHVQGWAFSSLSFDK